MIETLLTIVAVALRILSNPLGNVYQKRLTAEGQHPLLVNFLTYLLLALVCIPFAFTVQWRALPFNFWLYSILGGMVGALGNGFLVRALQRGDLSVLGPINSYKSVVSIIVGVFLLGEVPGLWGLLGIGLIVYGSYFVLDATDERFSLALLKRPEIQYRLWALLLTAIEAVFTKKYIQASSVMVATIGWCCFGALFAVVFLFVYRVDINNGIRKISLNDAGKYVLLLACVGTMQLTTNYAFAHMPVGYALSLFQLSVIISVLLGHRIFGEQDIRKKLIGSFIMIAGSVIIILLK